MVSCKNPQEVIYMQELKASRNRIVGLKQTVKAVKNETAKKVYVAEDADDFIKKSVLDACRDKNLQIIYVNNMKELGNACGIDIGASTAAIIID
jgi:large subunit ribosomal protein L7A